MNLFQILEYVRIIELAVTLWPGSRDLIRKTIETEIKERTPVHDGEKLLFEMCSIIYKDFNTNEENRHTETVRTAFTKVLENTSFYDTLDAIRKPWTAAIRRKYPDMASVFLQPPSFLPDFLYPGEIATTPLKDSAALLSKKNTKPRPVNRDAKESPEDNAESSSGWFGDYFYDEWSEFNKNYFHNHCVLREFYKKAERKAELPHELKIDIRRIKRVFEMIKPKRIEKEKYLEDGDSINHELLVDYIAEKNVMPAPKINFYEKNIVNVRDVAVLLLMDISGSTGNEVGSRRVLDVEKQAVLLLGEGLHIIGDTFSICGFSGQGRENCIFNIYKDFDQPWNNTTKGAVFDAVPQTSTRIGAALRHAGVRLYRLENKHKLLLLITDGKAMDTEYDSTTLYAQFDVKKANQENREKGVHTFAISTDETSSDDMQIMFQSSGYCVISKLEMLPKVLPKIYLHFAT